MNSILHLGTHTSLWSFKNDSLMNVIGEALPVHGKKAGSLKPQDTRSGDVHVHNTRWSQFPQLPNDSERETKIEIEIESLHAKS